MIRRQQILAVAAAFIAAATFFFCANTLLAQGTNTVNLRIISFNIHHAEGLDGVIDTQRIADLINAEQADLVGLQEVDVGTTRVSGRNLIAELAQKSGMNYVFSNNLSFQGGQYGNGILSKFPIKFRDHRLLTQVGASEQRGWLKAVVDVNGNDLSFWCTHLDSRSTNAERLLSVTNFNSWLDNETAPVIFVGDFNDNPFGAVYNRMTSKWNDTWAQIGVGLGNTIPASSPSSRIDFIWTSKDAPFTPVSAHVPVTTISDHRPVVATLSFTLKNANPPPSIYFPLNEGTGTNVNDSANLLFGNFAPPAPLWTNDVPINGAGEHALFFNGASLINAADTNRLIGLNSTNADYTLQAWAKLPFGFNPAARMIMFQYQGFPGFSFSINTNRTLHTTAFTIKDVNSTAVVPNDNQWHHAAVVHDSGVEMRFYLDGQLASTVAYTNGPGARTSYLFTIGGASSGANLFTGTLDRIRYAPLALTPAEFDLPPQPVSLQLRKSASSLILYWPATQTGYILESTPNLSTPVWTTVPHSVQGQENQASISPSNVSRFYRLKK